MASYNRKVKRQRAKQQRQSWQVRIRQRVTEFYQKPKWWQKIDAVSKLNRSLEQRKKKVA